MRLVKGQLVALVRPGANEAHVSGKDIPQLWQFIQAALTQEMAYIRYPRIRIGTECGTVRVSNFRRIHRHGAEFQDLEGAPP